MKLENLYKSRGIDERDLRFSAQRYVTSCLAQTTVGILLMRDPLLNISWWRNSGYPEAGEAELVNNAQQFLGFCIRGTFLYSFNAMEYYYRTIGNHLMVDRDIGKWSIMKIVSELVNEGRISQPFASFIMWFDIMTSLRNCIHNNGIYLSDDVKSKAMIFRGNKYQFKNGESPYLSIEKYVEMQFLMIEAMCFHSRSTQVLDLSPIPDVVFTNQSKIEWQ